jgi:DNA repair protein RadD
VAHAAHVASAFCAAGAPAALVTGDMPDAERRAILAEYASGRTRVVVNVAVLTEGWDHPPTSCVVLLRPSSFKCTMIQMVGRGLRIVDPNEYPGIVKTDCIVLDFGTSSQLHGSLEQDVDLDLEPGSGDAPTKICPSCEAEIPISVMQCPLCDHVFEPHARETTPLTDFLMTEIDLLKRSSFQWCDLFGDNAALVAHGFVGWGGIFFLNGRWHAVGGAKGHPSRLLAIGERVVCLAAADDWLNEHESDESAHKTKRWLREAPTDKQLIHLPPAARADLGMTRYQASALLTFQFNRNAIRGLVMSADPASMARAA